MRLHRGRHHDRDHGQRTLTIAAEVKYTASEAWLPKLLAVNKQHGPAWRYEEIMKAEGLFEVSS